MKRRLVIVSEIIAPYRIPAFNALAQHDDIEPHVVFLSETDPALRHWRIYKDEIRFSYEVLPSWRRRMGKFNLLLNWGLARALRRAHPEAILCGGYSYISSWTAAFWAQCRGVPLLLWSESTIHDLRARHGTVEFLKSRFLDRCDGFVVPGKSSFVYLKNLGVSEPKIFTAPNAVDIDFFSRAAQISKNGWDTRRKLGLPDRYFVYVGRMVTAKGIFELLEAYAKLDDELRSQIALVFVGDGAAKNELMKRASHIRPGVVHCVGFMHREELAAFYGLAEAVILPTYSDTWGLVINEAMACGLPVISSSVAGCAADLVQEAWNGFIVPPRDVPGLSAAMNSLAKRPELREQMSARSAQRIRSYSPEAWARGLAQAVEFVFARIA